MEEHRSLLLMYTTVLTSHISISVSTDTDAAIPHGKWTKINRGEKQTWRSCFKYSRSFFRTQQVVILQRWWGMCLVLHFNLMVVLLKRGAWQKHKRVSDKPGCIKPTRCQHFWGCTSAGMQVDSQHSTFIHVLVDRSSEKGFPPLEVGGRGD